MVTLETANRLVGKIKEACRKNRDMVIVETNPELTDYTISYPTVAYTKGSSVGAPVRRVYGRAHLLEAVDPEHIRNLVSPKVAQNYHASAVTLAADGRRYFNLIRRK